MHLMILFFLYVLLVVLLGSARYIYIPLTILHFFLPFLFYVPSSSLFINWYDQLVLSCPSTYG